MDIQRKRGLAPCPLCGGDAVFVRYKRGVFVKCSWCELMIAKQISVTTEDILPFNTAEDAIKVWNRRNGETVAPAEMSGMNAIDGIRKNRDARVQRIMQSIRRGDGAFVTVEQIARDAGLSKSMVNNSMQYVKKKYPQIKSRQGYAGYYWEEN